MDRAARERLTVSKLMSLAIGEEIVCGGKASTRSAERGNKMNGRIKAATLRSNS
jgi:hypothetical protein